MLRNKVRNETINEVKETLNEEIERWNLLWYENMRKMNKNTDENLQIETKYE